MTSELVEILSQIRSLKAAFDNGDDIPDVEDCLMATAVDLCVAYTALVDAIRDGHKINVKTLAAELLDNE